MDAPIRPFPARHRKLCIAVLIGLAVHGSGAAIQPARSAGAAASMSTDYDVPGGALGTTLDSIAQSSGRSISFDCVYRSSKRAPAIQGRYVPSIRGRNFILTAKYSFN